VPSKAPILIGDRAGLYQLFSNLIGNAIHPASPGGRIEVSVKTPDDGDAFQTMAPPSSKDRTSQKKASDLGIDIVRKIVEAHRGRIHVEKEVGEGPRFVLSLPRETELALERSSSTT